MTFRGRVQGGVIVLEPGTVLPEGTDVEVASLTDVGDENHNSEPTVWQKLADLARWAETQPCDLPTDLAHNHDHYIHGTPKRP